MRKHSSIRNAAWTALVALGGIVLYVPAAIGLIVCEAVRRSEPEDNGWRFSLAQVEDAQTIAVTCRREADLWSQMNLRQYFTVVPGATAVARGFCAFSRPAMLHA